MPELTPLSDAEKEIMELVWDHGELSATEVRELLSKPLARTTVQTMVMRMVEKGWLRHRAIGRTFVFSPTVPREESHGVKVRELIDSAFGGRAEELMLSLLEYRGLSEAEAKKIRAILDEAEQKKPTKKRKS